MATKVEFLEAISQLAQRAVDADEPALAGCLKAILNASAIDAEDGLDALYKPFSSQCKLLARHREGQTKANEIHTERWASRDEIVAQVAIERTRFKLLVFGHIRGIKKED